MMDEEQYKSKMHESGIELEELELLREKAREKERKLKAEMAGVKPMSPSTFSAHTKQSEKDGSEEYSNHMASFWKNKFHEESARKLPSSQKPFMGENDFEDTAPCAITSQHISTKGDEDVKKKNIDSTVSSERRVRNSPPLTQRGLDTKKQSSREKQVQNVENDVKSSARSERPEKNTKVVGSLDADSEDKVPVPGAYALEGPGFQNGDDDSVLAELRQADIGDTANATVTSQSLDGLIEATMVTDAEKIAYAEDTKHDRLRVIMLSITCFCILLIVLTVSLVATRDPTSSSTDPCDAPPETLSISRRCQCSNSQSAGAFFDESLSEDGRASYFELKEFLINEGILEANVTLDVDSCDRWNINLLIAANISDSSTKGTDIWRLSSRDFRVSVHAFIDMYVIMGGLDWSMSTLWLSDQLCNWFSLRCIFVDIIEELSMPTNNLTGSIPTTVGLMRTLRGFEISDNALTGGIPTEIGQMAELQDIAITGGFLSGTIPTEISLLRKVLSIDLSFNQLTGNIPSHLWDLRNLRSLRLSNNTLSGTLPETIGNATRLIELDLGYNSLNGTLPSEMQEMKELRIVALNNNSFTGFIPNFLGDLPRLKVLYLQESGLTGSIPDTFCDPDQHRKIVVSCPQGKIPMCKDGCCSSTNATRAVQIICSDY